MSATLPKTVTSNPITGQSLSQTPYTLSPATNGLGYSSLGYPSQTITITGGGGGAGTGYNVANIPHNGNYTYTNTTSSGNIKVHGDAEFSGDIKLQGKSLVKMLEQIEIGRAHV